MRNEPGAIDRPADREHGAALIWSLMFVIIVSGMIISHSTFMAANRRNSDVLLRQKPLSDTFARSGLTDAVAWFRKQPTQPVTSFAPQLDPMGDPPVLDTIDPTVGLVREFSIRGNLWGRYEVRTNEAADISLERGVTQSGGVWELGGRGIVYELRDPSRPFNVAPNRIVSISAVKSELRGIPLVPPAPGAVSLLDENKLVLDNGAVIDGGSKPGIVYRDPVDASDTPYVDPDHDPLDLLLPVADIKGFPAQMALPTFDMTPRKVFAMELDDLRSYADQSIPDGSSCGGGVRDGSVVFVRGDMVVTAAEPLKGRMLLVVTGNLAFAVDNDSDFEGFVYVAGDVAMKGKLRFRGSIVAGGLFKIYKDAEVIYDEPVLQSLQSSLSRYRLSRQLREVTRVE